MSARPTIIQVSYIWDVKLQPTVCTKFGMVRRMCSFHYYRKSIQTFTKKFEKFASHPSIFVVAKM